MKYEKLFTETITVTKKVKLPYLLYLPDNYDELNKHPLVLFLHGMGERGSNLNKLSQQGLPQIAQKKNFPFIMLAPQCSDDIEPYRTWIGLLDELKALIDNIITLYKVDVKRIYITGLSMGGYGTWEMIQHYPNLFAAAIPICGGGSINHLHLVKHLPIWTFHGAKDEIIPISESLKMVEYLQGIGNNVRFTIYPDATHDSWTETYNNPDVLKWLLSHTNNKNF